jgi:hypothetical protein
MKEDLFEITWKKALLYSKSFSLSETRTLGLSKGMTL